MAHFNQTKPMKNKTLENLADAISKYGGGASMLHPRITIALSAARKELQEPKSDSAVCSGFVSDTPETDAAKFGQKNMPIGYMMVKASLAKKLERERNEYLIHREQGKMNGHIVAMQRDALQKALRDMTAAKGRYNTQKAMEHLISLLPENQ